MRLIRFAILVFSTSLAACSAALWGVSYYHNPPSVVRNFSHLRRWKWGPFEFQRSREKFLPPWNLVVHLNRFDDLWIESDDGMVSCYCFRDLPNEHLPGEWRFNLGSFECERSTLSWDGPCGYTSALMSEAEREHERTTTPCLFSVEFPLWFPTLLFGAWPILALIRGPMRRRYRRKRGLCLRCGYSLTGLPQPRCPECGTEFDDSEPS